MFCVPGELHCPGGNCPGGQLSQGTIVLGGNCPGRGGNCPGGNCPGGNCPGGNCPGGNCPVSVKYVNKHFHFKLYSEENNGVEKFIVVIIMEWMFVLFNHK